MKLLPLMVSAAILATSGLVGATAVRRAVAANAAAANAEAAAKNAEDGTGGLYLYGGTENGGPVIEYQGGSDGDDDDFEGWTGKPRVVEFYSPYCGHCISFKPEYVKMAQSYPSKAPRSSPLRSARFHAVSCAAHKDLCAKYDVNSYPTLFALPEGVDGPKGARPIKRSVLKGNRYTVQGLNDALDPASKKEVKVVDDAAVETPSRRLEDDGDEKEEEEEPDDDEVSEEDKEDDEDGDAAGDDDNVDEEEGDEKADDSDEGAKEEKKDDEDKDEDEKADALAKMKDSAANKQFGGGAAAAGAGAARAARATADKEDSPAGGGFSPLSRFGKKPGSAGAAATSDKETSDGRKRTAPGDMKLAGYAKKGGGVIAVEGRAKANGDEDKDKDDVNGESPEEDEDKDDDDEDEEEEDDEDEEEMDEEDDREEEEDDEDEDKSPPRYGAGAGSGAGAMASRYGAGAGTGDGASVGTRAGGNTFPRTPFTERAGGAAGGPGVQPRPGGTSDAFRPRPDGIPRPGMQPEDIAKWREDFAKRRAELEKKHKSFKRPFQRPLKDAKKAGTNIPVDRYKQMPEKEKTKLREDKLKQNSELMKKRAEIAKKFKEMRETEAKKTRSDGGKTEPKRGGFFSRGGKQPPPVAPVAVPPGGKPPQPSGGLTKKVLSNVPVVKRAFKSNPEEELYGDAALSFVAGIKMGVFNSNKPLSGKRKEALVDWLELLSVSLPPELGVHEIVDALHSHMDYISQGQDKLNKILDEHPLSNKFWSQSCSKGRKGQGFSCGFWKLLHLMSVGLSEQRGGIELCTGEDPLGEDEPRVFSTLEASSVLREYMAQFFGCETCRNNFISKFDDCSFNRCSRLQGGDPDQLTIEEWREFPLWIWEFHNDVSVRVAGVKAKMSDSRKKTFGDAMVQQWPAMEDCFLCIKEDGEWDMEEVYEYLEKTYWSGADLDAPAKALRQYERSLGLSRGAGRSSLQFYSGVGLLLLLAYTVKRRKVIATGMHKKFDRTPGGGGKKA